MNFFLSAGLSYLLIYKYVALFVIIFLGSVGLPIPALTILIAAAAFSSEGYFSLPEVIIASGCASIFGDILMFSLVRKWGTKILIKLKLGKIISSRQFKKIEGKFYVHPIRAIYLSRFNNLTSLSVNILGGLSQIKFTKFLLWDALGEMSVVLFCVIIGYVFGNNWEYVAQLIGKFSIIIILTVVIIAVLYVKFFSPTRQKN